ncbi:hypothetical protein [Fructobacillus fructosus]|uniref:Uncharacterized protein n=1 Tax=Fructobacillus fructosus TaxID=1631 RepID=A0ABM9MXD4_9LACO|nr:hypothetical protein [Fructobacillus fructosus]MBC9119086.1 hypothetical protein [Fructobacillus fructosus]MBD9366102.1 hypothetical protein [Leuconostoc mesenteroides]MCK8638648.1 hypothetical protein [Fructobacillus fructosus]CAK1246887.1 hypothetical protein R54839_PPFHFPJH_01167 [Fructobacillus fructosus]
MALIIRVLLAIYASLMMLATWQTKKTNLSWLNYLTNLVAIVLLVATFLAWPNFVILSILSLVAFQILAVVRGLLLHDFHWQHHLVRLLVTIVLIWLIVSV